MDNSVGRRIQDGVCRYADSHAHRRWGDLAAVPTVRIENIALSPYRNADGLIVGLTTRRLEQQVRAMGIPVVSVSGALARPAFPSFMVDNVKVGQSAAAYFLDRGYRHFGYNASNAPNAYSDQRGQGFVSVIHAAGYEVDWWGDYPARSVNGAVRVTDSLTDWLVRSPKPMAVFVTDDNYAAILHAAAIAAGLSVPEQVAILGVNDEPNMHFGMLGISSIDQPFEQIGYEAAALLDRMLDGHQPQQRITRLPPGRIITRTSSDSRAVNDPLVLEALRFIREHACAGAGVEDVAAAVPMSKRSLQRRFVAEIGSTIADELMRIRLANARKLLAGTAMSVQEISDACGFGDRSRFSVAFHRHEGTQPTAYRRQFRRT